MSAQRRRSRHAGPSSVRPSCLANIAEPLPSLSSPKKGLGGQDAVKTSVEGQWPPQSARVDDPPEAGVPAYESDAETKENPMDDSAEYLLEEQLPPRRLDHLIADTKRDLASSKEKYPDTEFTDWLLSGESPRDPCLYLFKRRPC